MADNRLEWFPFLYERFLVSTFGWDAEEVGAYLLLLCHQWDKGFIPSEITEIRKITRTHHRRNIDKVLKKFVTYEDTQLNEEGKEYDTDFIQQLKGSDKRMNERLYIVRVKQEGKRLKNKESGSKGGEARARNLANATDSLKHIEQNRTEVEQKRESTHTSNLSDHAEQKRSGQSSEKGTPTENSGTEQGQKTQLRGIETQSSTGKGSAQNGPDVVAHWKRLSQSSNQLDAFCMGAKRLGFFPPTMPADECRAGMIKIAETFQEEFDRVCPEGTYKIFGYKLDDHIKKLHADPNRKPWEKPAPTVLPYNLPVNKNA